LIALKSDQATVLGTIGPFTLSSGTASVSTTLLPIGTAFVEATYGGDVTHVVSTSMPPTALTSTVAGAGYTSKTALSLVTFDANNNPILSMGSQPIVYGAPYILQIAVTKSDGTSCSFAMPNTKPAIPCPTGKVTLTQNGSPSPGFPNGQTNLNNNGIVEDQPISLSATLSGTTPAVYTLAASYGGDANYSASSASTPLKLTVSKASTQVQVGSSLNSITSGQTVTLTATVGTASNGEAPCGITGGGTVQFTSNGTALTGTVSYTATSGVASSTGASCTAALTTAISALYTPPGDPRAPGTPVIPLVVALVSLALFALGWVWMPEQRRRTYACAGLMAIALLAAGIAGCGGSGGGTGGGSTRTIVANYSGDANYSANTSTPIIVH